MSSLWLCVFVSSFVICISGVSIATGEENESQHLCSCSPKLVCGGGGGGGPHSSNVTRDLLLQGSKIRDLYEKLTDVEQKYDVLLQELERINTTADAVVKANTWEVRRCDLDTVSSSPDYLVLDGTFATTSSFCQALASTYIIGPVYEISVDVFNKQGRGGVSFGHPGIMFNAENSKSYDIIYIRPHSTSGCYQTGYLENGSWKGAKQGPCVGGTPAGATWFNVKVKVDHFNVSVYLNGRLIVGFVSHFHARGQGGAFVWNGYNNIALFKNFKISSS